MGLGHDMLTVVQYLAVLAVTCEGIFMAARLVTKAVNQAGN